MARRQTAFFLPSTQTEIADSQTFTANVPLVLNTNASGACTILPNGNIGFANFQRTLSFYSATDISAINFVIVGLNTAGQEITETLAGPGGGTVYSVNQYQSIISITPDTTDPETITVGAGNTGTSQWFSVNNFSPYYQITLQTSVTNEIDYTIFSTLTEIQTPVLGGMPINTPYAKQFQSAQITSTSISSSNVASAYQYVVNSSDSTGSLNIVILQQGVR